MLSRIFKRTLALICLIPSLLIGWTSLYAENVGENSENPLNIIIEPSIDNQNPEIEKKLSTSKNPEKNNYPDLGDDQVFPFIAGLGSNSHL